MKTENFRVETLIAFLQRHKIATMRQLKIALGTTVDMTVFRKLRMIPYFSSCSHRGKFYTIESVVQFDERGLWTCRGVLFSRFGSLLDTVEQFVTRSDRGFLTSELKAELQVEVKHPLRQLVNLKRLTRKNISGLYVYCATNISKRTNQLFHRRTYGTVESLPFSRDTLTEITNDTQAAIILFLSTLDEKQRRLYAGLESLRMGHGGDSRLAELTGLDVHTIAKGRTELLQRDIQLDRIRKSGGGRHFLEKKRLKLSRQSRN